MCFIYPISESSRVGTMSNPFDSSSGGRQPGIGNLFQTAFGQPPAVPALQTTSFTMDSGQVTSSTSLGQTVSSTSVFGQSTGFGGSPNNPFSSGISSRSLSPYSSESSSSVFGGVKANPSGSSVFGGTSGSSSNTSVFGQSSGFGVPAGQSASSTGSGTSGQNPVSTASVRNVFGGQQHFGSESTTSTAQNVFSRPFSSSPASSSGGMPSSTASHPSAFGQTSNPFGKSSTSQTVAPAGNLFARSTANPFAKPQTVSSVSPSTLFGGSKSDTAVHSEKSGLFGKGKADQSNTFASKSDTGLFGKKPTATSKESTQNLFGKKKIGESTRAFGTFSKAPVSQQPEDGSQTGLFTGKPVKQEGLFGKPGGFGKKDSTNEQPQPSRLFGKAIQAAGIYSLKIIYCINNLLLII